MSAPVGPGDRSTVSSGLPETVRDGSALMLERIAGLDAQDQAAFRRRYTLTRRQDEEAARLMTIPGIGPIYRDRRFKPSLRQWRASETRPRLLRLAGPRAAPAHDRRQAEARQDVEDGPTRSQTAADHSARWRSSNRRLRRGETSEGSWLARMLARKPKMVVSPSHWPTEMARIVWALRTNKESYRAPVVA